MDFNGEVVEDRGVYELETLCALAALITKLHSVSAKLLPTRISHYRKVRKSFCLNTSVLTDTDFRISFCLSRSIFRFLVDFFRENLARDTKMVALHNGVIEPEVRVAVDLCILSGASYLDMLLLRHLARPTIYYIFEGTSDVLLEALKFESFPTTAESYARLANTFATSRRALNPLQGSIGALDGVSIRIRKPRLTDCDNPASYYHRKGHYTIPVQAVWDSNYKLTFMPAKCAGPTHDSVAFEVSSLCRFLRDGKIPEGLWMAADDAHVCDEKVITALPQEKSVARSSGDAFEFYQSSHKMHIEQAFGMVMARWIVLWRPVQFTLARNTRTIYLAMCLRNYCIDLTEEFAYDLNE